MTNPQVPQASYWTSFCAMIVSWCDQWMTLPNMVMVVAIIVPLLTYGTNLYWRWQERQDRLRGLDTRSAERRAS